MAVSSFRSLGKRSHLQRQDNNAVQFGELKIAQEDGEEGPVDEEYETSEGEAGSNDGEDEDFPDIDADSEISSDEEEEQGGLSEDEQILRELALEEELERDLQDTSDSSVTDDEAFDDNGSALNHAIRKATSKPNEDFDAGNGKDGARDISKIMTFDTRAFKDKAIIGKSDITGQDRWAWPNIEPGWESDEGAEDGPVRVGNIPAYFYDGMPHVGYDVEGKRVMRPVKGDELDKFLASVEDPSSWSAQHTRQYCHH